MASANSLSNAEFLRGGLLGGGDWVGDANATNGERPNPRQCRLVVAGTGAVGRSD